MTKLEAIRWFKEIQGGKGVDRASFPLERTKDLKKNRGTKSDFTLGIEYGAVIALWKIFNITDKDFKKYKTD